MKKHMLILTTSLVVAFSVQCGDAGRMSTTDANAIVDQQKQLLGAQRRPGERFEYSAILRIEDETNPLTFIRDAHTQLLKRLSIESERKLKTPPIENETNRIEKYTEILEESGYRERAKNFTNPDDVRIIAVALRDSLPGYLSGVNSNLPDDEIYRRRAIEKIFWKGRYDRVVDELKEKIKKTGGEVRTLLKRVTFDATAWLASLRNDIQDAVGFDRLQELVNKLKTSWHTQWNNLSAEHQKELYEVKEYLRNKLISEQGEQQRPVQRKRFEPLIRRVDEIGND